MQIFDPKCHIPVLMFLIDLSKKTPRCNYCVVVGDRCCHVLSSSFERQFSNAVFRTEQGNDIQQMHKQQVCDKCKILIGTNSLHCTN